MAVKKTLFWAYCDIWLLFLSKECTKNSGNLSLFWFLTLSLSFEGNPSLSAWLDFWLDSIKPKQIFVVHVESFCIPQLIECEVSRRITVFAGEPGQTIIITVLKLVFCAVEAQQCTPGFVQERSELMLAYNYYSQGIIISDLCIYF